MLRAPGLPRLESADDEGTASASQRCFVLISNVPRGLRLTDLRSLLQRHTQGVMRIQLLPPEPQYASDATVVNGGYALALYDSKATAIAAARTPIALLVGESGGDDSAKGRQQQTMTLAMRAMSRGKTQREGVYDEYVTIDGVQYPKGDFVHTKGLQQALSRAGNEGVVPKLCNYTRDKKDCPYGLSCKFLHLRAWQRTCRARVSLEDDLVEDLLTSTTDESGPVPPNDDEDLYWQRWYALLRREQHLYSCSRTAAMVPSTMRGPSIVVPVTVADAKALLSVPILDPIHIESVAADSGIVDHGHNEAEEDPPASDNEDEEEGDIDWDAQRCQLIQRIHDAMTALRSQCGTACTHFVVRLCTPHGTTRDATLATRPRLLELRRQLMSSDGETKKTLHDLCMSMSSRDAFCARATERLSAALAVDTGAAATEMLSDSPRVRAHLKRALKQVTAMSVNDAAGKLNEQRLAEHCSLMIQPWLHLPTPFHEMDIIVRDGQVLAALQHHGEIVVDLNIDTAVESLRARNVVTAEQQALYHHSCLRVRQIVHELNRIARERALPEVLRALGPHISQQSQQHGGSGPSSFALHVAFPNNVPSALMPTPPTGDEVPSSSVDAPSGVVVLGVRHWYLCCAESGLHMWTLNQELQRRAAQGLVPTFRMKKAEATSKLPWMLRHALLLLTAPDL